MVKRRSLRALEDGLGQGASPGAAPLSRSVVPLPMHPHLPPSGTGREGDRESDQGLSPGIIDARSQVLPTINIQECCGAAWL